MKISKKVLLGATLLLSAFGSSTAHAQLGTPRYSFRSRDELKTLLLQNARDSRALYDLTILAHRRGWLGTALSAGDELFRRNRRDPNAQALIAFCVYSGLYAREWNWPIDATAGDLWKRQAEASAWQNESLRGQTPAIQMMAAISLANLPTSRGFDEALRLFRVVLKKQPKWADAHYWYGRAMDRASTQKTNAQRQQVLKQVLAQYDRAEQLDKGLHTFLLISRSGRLEELGRPREALAAFEGYLRVYPAFAQDLEERFPGYVAKTRTRLTEARRKQS